MTGTDSEASWLNLVNHIVDLARLTLILDSAPLPSGLQRAALEQLAGDAAKTADIARSVASMAKEGGPWPRNQQ
ncbi:hypothetical protein [Streptomyces sp. 4R-3d]|uniref:hypothetical protein n=1 Tax=Streptomyces sp. 4R-3d TaxID=2559605 RepID=UPI00107201F9|nr:hypothetical protein [Streptomyces sp. 4R-3d]TFI25539.1 hypothetical protein E4P36_19035 [Streptomyces sp. 4R-3d]